MIKKISDQDKKDWKRFINNNERLENKDKEIQKNEKNFIIKSIDLHGYTHDDAKQNLENELILEYNNNNFPVLIITGNSTKMKSIVYEVSKELNFTVTTPLDNNIGTLVVK